MRLRSKRPLSVAVVLDLLTGIIAAQSAEAGPVQDPVGHPLRITDSQLSTYRKMVPLDPPSAGGIQERSPTYGLPPSSILNARGTPVVSITCPSAESGGSASSSLTQAGNPASCFYKARLLRLVDDESLTEASVDVVRDFLIGGVLGVTWGLARDAARKNCTVRSRERDDVNVSYVHFGWAVEGVRWRMEPWTTLEGDSSGNATLHADRLAAAGSSGAPSLINFCRGSPDLNEFRDGNFNAICGGSTSRAKWVQQERIHPIYKSDVFQGFKLSGLKTSLEVKLAYYLYCDNTNRGELDGCPAQLAQIARLSGMTSVSGISLPMESGENPDQIYRLEHTVSIPEHEFQGRALAEILSSGDLQLSGLIYDRNTSFRATAPIAEFMDQSALTLANLQENFKFCGLAPAKAVTDPSRGRGDGFYSKRKSVSLPDAIRDLFVAPMKKSATSMIQHIERQAILDVLPRQIKQLLGGIERTSELMYSGELMGSVDRWVNRSVVASTAGRPGWAEVSLLGKSTFAQTPSDLSADLSRNSCLLPPAPSSYSGAAGGFVFNGAEAVKFAHGLHDLSTQLASDLALTQSTVCAPHLFTSPTLSCSHPGHCRAPSGSGLPPNATQLEFSLTQLPFPSFEWRTWFPPNLLSRMGMAQFLMLGEDYVPRLPELSARRQYISSGGQNASSVRGQYVVRSSDGRIELARGEFWGTPQTHEVLAHRKCQGWILRPTEWVWNGTFGYSAAASVPDLEIVTSSGVIPSLSGTSGGQLDLRPLEGVVNNQVITRLSSQGAAALPLYPASSVKVGSTPANGAPFALVGQNRDYFRLIESGDCREPEDPNDPGNPDTPDDGDPGPGDGTPNVDLGGLIIPVNGR